MIAAALWLAGPTVIRFATTAYIDVGLTLFVLGGAYGLFRWIERRELGWLLFAAFSTGMAAGCKYSGLFFLLFYALKVSLWRFFGVYHGIAKLYIVFRLFKAL